MSFFILMSFFSFNDVKTNHVDSSGSDTIQCNEISIKCLDVYDKQFIIRNEKEYKGLLEFESPSSCPYSLPKIDFTQYSLIGVGSPSSGCPAPKFEHYLLKTDQFNYKLILNITEYGMCKELILISKWYLIPKIDDKVNVAFLIHRTRE
jgi:hypothetical protein